MIQKLFGKFAGIASGVLLTAIAIVQLVKPELLGTDLAVTLMTIFGVYGTVSDTPVKAAKK